MKKGGNNIYWERKKKKRGSVRKGAEGSRINDFIMPLRNIKMREITVRGGRGDKCVRERYCVLRLWEFFYAFI